MERIGILGPANAGKDTAATLIQRHLPDCVILPFSYFLYQEVSKAFGVEVDDLKRRETKERYWIELDDCSDEDFLRVLPTDYDVISPRLLLQLWGTEYRRKQDPDYWVKRVDQYLMEINPRYAIHPDVRFLNELSPCSYSFVIRRPQLEIFSSHESDQLWREASEKLYVIYNVAGLEELEMSCLEVLSGNIFVYSGAN